MHDVQALVVAPQTGRRRLRYGYCTRRLGRSSRMRSAGLPFFRLRPAWPSPWAISVGPMHRGIQMHHHDDNRSFQRHGCDATRRRRHLSAYQHRFLALATSVRRHHDDSAQLP